MDTAMDTAMEEVAMDAAVAEAAVDDGTAEAIVDRVAPGDAGDPWPPDAAQDTSVTEAAVDARPSDGVVDGTVAETATDARPSDSRVDATVAETAADAVTPESAVDARPPDAAVDTTVAEAAADARPVDTALDTSTPEVAVDARADLPEVRPEPLVPTGECSVATSPTELAAFCGALSPCPITRVTALECPRNAGRPSLVARGAEALTVLLPTLERPDVTAAVSYLFTVPATSAPRVERIPFLSGRNLELVADRSGRRSIVSTEGFETLRYRELPLGWVGEVVDSRRGDAVAPFMVSAAAHDDENAVVVIRSDFSNTLTVHPRTAAGWTRQALSPARYGAVGRATMDPVGRPWVAYWDQMVADGLRLRSPDGTQSEILGFGDYRGDMELVPGGLDGREERPAVVAWRSLDELHLLLPTAPTGYRDQLLPVPTGAFTGDCPAIGQWVDSTRPCRELTQCSRRSVRAYLQVGAARGSDGALYIAILAEDRSERLYDLYQTCSSFCMCIPNRVVADVVTELRVLRVNATGAREVLRVRVSAEPATYLSRLPLVATGAGLAVLVPSHAGTVRTALRVVELDPSRFPR